MRRTIALILGIAAALALFVSVGGSAGAPGVGSAPLASVAGGPPCVSVPAVDGMCLHVDRPTPVGLEPLAQTRPASQQPLRLPCTPDDGGPVIHVYYGYYRTNDLDKGPRPSRALLAQGLASADYLINEAAKATGGTRHIRFYTPGCQLSITPIRLQSDSFNEIAAQLGVNFNQPGDKYLLVTNVPGGFATCGGLGSVMEDDSPGSTNYNNRFESLAYVYCAGLFDWNTGEVIAHEITHTLGGVQSSAPNATGSYYFHCTDESDLMCYDDGSGKPMRQVCPRQTPEPIDCNKDDYFNVSPSSSSYLGKHWNTADSRWLMHSDPAKWITLPTPKATPKVPASIGGRIAIPITVQQPRGASVDRVELIADGEVIGSDSTPPFRVVFDPPASRSGKKVRFKARVYDAFGRSFDSRVLTSLLSRPAVTLTSPKPQEAVAGSVVRAAASARAFAGNRVKRVEFLVDGVVKATDVTAPYAATLRIGAASSPQISARVTDSANRVAESASATVHVLQPTVLLSSDYGDYPANTSLVVPVFVELPPPGLWAPLAATIEVLVDGRVRGTDRKAETPRMANGRLLFTPLVRFPGPGNHRLKVRLRANGVTLAESYEAFIRTASAPRSLAIVAPAAGPVSATTTARAEYAGGNPDWASVTFAVDDGYGTAAAEDLSLRLTLTPGLHVITASYTAAEGGAFVRGPSVIVEAPSTGAKVAVVSAGTLGAQFSAGATITGLPHGWSVDSVTWYLNGAEVGYDYDGPWKASCNLPAGLTSGAADLRAVALLRHSNGETMWLVSPPRRVTLKG